MKSEPLSRNRHYPLEGIERQNIKITDLKVTLLSFEYPPEEQLRVGRGIWWKSDSIIVEIFTDQGIVGIGGSSRYSGAGCCLPVKAFLEAVVKPVLIGKNPFDVHKLAWGGGTNVGRSAWAGAEAAMFDIIGKACGRPGLRTFSLLIRSPTPASAYTPAPGSSTLGTTGRISLSEEAAAIKDQGFTAYKFRPGTYWDYSGMTVDKFVPYLAGVREAVGPDFDLALELRPWSLEEALQLAPVLEDLKFTWFEEPMTRDGEDAFDRHLRLQEALPDGHDLGWRGLNQSPTS